MNDNIKRPQPPSRPVNNSGASNAPHTPGKPQKPAPKVAPKPTAPSALDMINDEDFNEGVSIPHEEAKQSHSVLEDMDLEIPETVSAPFVTQQRPTAPPAVKEPSIKVAPEPIIAPSIEPEEDDFEIDDYLQEAEAEMSGEFETAVPADNIVNRPANAGQNSGGPILNPTHREVNYHGQPKPKRLAAVEHPDDLARMPPPGSYTTPTQQAPAPPAAPPQAPPPVTRSAPTSAQSKDEKASGKSFFASASKPRKSSNAMPPRMKATLIRWVVVGGIVSLAATGVYQTFIAPDPTPTGEELVSLISDTTGETTFPTGQAESFVKSFTEAYFTYPEGMSSSEYKDGLATYMNTSLTTGTLFNPNGLGQEITAGPYVANIRYVGDTLVSYTVQVGLNGSSDFTYVEFPVYYDEEHDAFLIMGTPGIVPAPDQAATPEQPGKTWSDDPDISSEVKQTFTDFFTAWGTSDEEALTRLIDPEASFAVTAGLGVEGIIASNIQDIQVEANPDDVNYATARTARVTVTWQYSNGVTITSAYELRIKYDGTRWNIMDIRAGVIE